MCPVQRLLYRTRTNRLGSLFADRIQRTRVRCEFAILLQESLAMRQLSSRRSANSAIARAMENKAMAAPSVTQTDMRGVGHPCGMKSRAASVR